jgi:DNA adenine methylase
MSGNSKKLIAFNYFGGKHTWVDYLYPHFPEHDHFIDVFAGSFAVTLNKKRSKIDTANDINSDVFNFFKVLREKPEELIHLLMLTPVSREEYNNCFLKDKEVSDVERARMFFVRSRQSFYGLGAQHKNKGWHCSKTIFGKKYGQNISKWINSIDKLDAILERLSTIQIENQCFRKLIPKIDFKNAFFYCDPPYPLESRKSSNDYKFDFTDQDHQDLAMILNNIKGKAMISGYECNLMNKLYQNWRKIFFPIKKNNIRNGKVQEVIWMNYDPEKEIQTALDF